jgi:type I restriction enzyme R subunit
MTEPDTYLTSEAKARLKIDEMLVAAGWVVQDANRVNLQAARGVAVREFVLKRPHGKVDYLLFVDGNAVGVVEAKKEGETLTGVEWQNAKYVEGLPDDVPSALEGPLPFAYESTGIETRFTNALEPDARSREVFSFHHPETFAEWVGEVRKTPLAPTLRHRLRALPPLDATDLWQAQERAIENLETSLADNRPRALIQMATGAGKTFTAANIAYRLVRFANARRVLFLVDRANLGKQTLAEFQKFATPGDGRKFSDLYNIQRLTSQRIDPVARVTISTVQRLYSVLRGDTEFNEELDEHSADSVAPPRPVEVAYNPLVPPETFDVVIVDECHRSIYGVWRQVLDYFDAFVIGLTATPNKQAFGFFDQNLVMEYTHEQAVVDKVNVPFDVYRIRTEISEQGGEVDAGIVTQFRNRETRAHRLERLDEDVTYAASDLDRAVVAKDQIRTVIRAFRDRLFTEIFPGRLDVPKTLIFAKDDSHADDIVQIVREEFGKGSDFAVKITYRSTGQKTDDLIAAFRNSYNPRIAVTVDMIATGTDIKPLECVFFMRSVKSRTYFEQMKGRGVRVIDPDTFHTVTADALAKDRYVIVDAVGVTESDLMDTQPLEREPTVPLEKLLRQISYGVREPEVASSVASRLVSINRRLPAAEREKIEQLAGMPIAELARGIVEALDPDRQAEATGKPDPTDEELTQARKRLLDEAVAPIATSPELRERLVEARRLVEQLIDEFTRDKVVAAGYSLEGADRARETVESFRRFLDEHKDEITALQVLYSRPYRRRLSFAEIRELARAIELPPNSFTPERLWQAYAQLERSKVRGSGRRVLTDIVSLVRFALEQEDELVPYPDLVEQRFEAWLAVQRTAGREFTPEQLRWLDEIADHVAASLAITPDDFQGVPFIQQGGLGKAYELFGDELNSLLDELNEALAA